MSYKNEGFIANNKFDLNLILLGIVYLSFEFIPLCDDAAVLLGEAGHGGAAGGRLLPVHGQRALALLTFFCTIDIPS